MDMYYAFTFSLITVYNFNARTDLYATVESCCIVFPLSNVESQEVTTENRAIDSFCF